MLLQDIDGACTELEALRALGIRVAIDDFGTGYSSLSYLARLPVDVVKIDKSFVKGLHVHSGRKVLVRAIVDLASALGLDIVAEGVELNELDCTYVQGFLYSPAISEMEFERWTAGRENADARRSPTHPAVSAAPVGG
jgi:EAL domain-containing protein (putative c-di-GMP-specific phosphodiesterase class I)